MKTSMIRSLTVLSLASVSTAFAGDGKYGAAPASLDYPVSKSVKKAPAGASVESRKREIAEMQREELYLLSVRNPFPKTPIAPVDPITKKKVDGVHVGPAFRARASGGGFDYYRYVTFYEIDERREVITSLPVIRQQCYDRSDLFAGYTFTFSRSATLKVGVSYEGLGLDTSMTATETQSVSRNFAPTKDIVADYTPYFVKQDQYGRTFIQTYDSKTERVAFVTKEVEPSAWWVQAFFPLMATTRYPYPFEAIDAKWIFEVERTILGRCEDEIEASARETAPSDTNLTMLPRKRVKNGKSGHHDE